MHRSSTAFPQRRDSRSGSGRHRAFRGCFFALAIALTGIAAGAQTRPSALLFRIFLADGATLVSYGEFARVGGRVVFSVPLGDVAAEPKLQVVTIGESLVDWEKTEAYADAVRAQHYASTRGEQDFALLTGQVTTALNDMALTPDPKRRLAMAEEARRNLAAWPAANHGYKAAEVAQLIGIIEDVIAEMRVDAGVGQFDLSLVATTLPPPPMPLMAPPDVRGSFEAAYRSALVAADPAERTALLRTLAESIAYAPRTATWAVPLRSQIDAALAAEVRTDNAYRSLAASTMRTAAALAGRADVRGLQSVIARALRSDQTLGRKRPGEMAALLAALDGRLDEARRLRLARDAWVLRLEAVREYRDRIAAPIQRLAQFRKWLEGIRDLSGPDARFLRPLSERARLAHLELMGVTPPAEAQAVHGLFAAALHLTRQAAELRMNAVSSTDIKVAWDASAAAAGALTLGERALADLERLISSEPTR